MTENKILKKCPTCGKKAEAEYAPFCSKRCADVDLNRWLKGTYVVHTNEPPTEADLENIAAAGENK